MSVAVDWLLKGSVSAPAHWGGSEVLNRVQFSTNFGKMVGSCGVLLPDGFDCSISGWILCNNDNVAHVGWFENQKEMLALPNTGLHA